MQTAIYAHTQQAPGARSTGNSFSKCRLLCIRTHTSAWCAEYLVIARNRKEPGKENVCVSGLLCCAPASDPPCKPAIPQVKGKEKLKYQGSTSIFVDKTRVFQTSTCLVLFASDFVLALPNLSLGFDSLP